MVVTILTEQLVDPDAEVPASVREARGVGSGRLHLLVVEIPRLDDSITTVTRAVWVGALEEDAGIQRAARWSMCGRGVTGDGLCV